MDFGFSIIALGGPRESPVSWLRFEGLEKFAYWTVYHRAIYWSQVAWVTTKRSYAPFRWHSAVVRWVNWCQCLQSLAMQFQWLVIIRAVPSSLLVCELWNEASVNAMKAGMRGHLPGGDHDPVLKVSDNRIIDRELWTGWVTHMRSHGRISVQNPVVYLEGWVID